MRLIQNDNYVKKKATSDKQIATSDKQIATADKANELHLKKKPHLINKNEIHLKKKLHLIKKLATSDKAPEPLIS